MFYMAAKEYHCGWAMLILIEADLVDCRQLEFRPGALLGIVVMYTWDGLELPSYRYSSSSWESSRPNSECDC